MKRLRCNKTNLDDTVVLWYLMEYLHVEPDDVEAVRLKQSNDDYSTLIVAMKDRAG